MQTFNDRHAREILEPCGIDRYITIDERGVWPAAKYDATDGVNLFRWRAARVSQGEPGAPEVADTPMLPFPFTARQLAAFMVEGVGALASDFYGDYECGPDPASLNAIDLDSNARTAIVQAYAARREAEQIVEAYPLELEAKAARARKAWSEATTEANIREGVSNSIPDEDSKLRRERAKASVSELDSEMKAANDAARVASEKWLNAMVRELLKPAPAQTATPAPVVADSDGPAPLTTGNIAHCLSDLRWDERGWKDTLGEVKSRKWLQDCIAIPGQQGVSEARWNPVLIGAWLVHQGHENVRRVRARFQTVDLLRPWLDAWKTYEADNFGSE